MRRTVRRLALLVAVIPLMACPYEAAVEPNGAVLPLRPAIVGGWLCSTKDDPRWAELLVGWSKGTYLFSVRKTKPAERGSEEDAWVVSGRPRQVGGREIWVLWDAEPRAEGERGEPGRRAKTFSFIRVEAASRRILRLSSLGDGSLGGDLSDLSAEVVARTLGSAKAVVEIDITCRR